MFQNTKCVDWLLPAWTHDDMKEVKQKGDSHELALILGEVGSMS
jgi:hypothetical protein